jgi:hypothetical protein
MDKKPERLDAQEVVCYAPHATAEFRIMPKDSDAFIGQAGYFPLWPDLFGEKGSSSL